MLSSKRGKCSQGNKVCMLERTRAHAWQLYNSQKYYPHYDKVPVIFVSDPAVASCVGYCVPRIYYLYDLYLLEYNVFNSIL